MKVCALLVWYDEPPELLRETVASWGQISDIVVALDGPFDDYPHGGKLHSGDEQVRAIRAGARATSHGSVVLGTHRPFKDHCEKRSKLLASARTMFRDPERWWYFLPDADEQLEADPFCAGDLQLLLEGTDHDVAEMTVEIQVGEEMIPARQRRLMRALPGLRVEGLHYRYVTGEGLPLWDEPDRPQRPAAKTSLQIRHRRAERPQERLDAAKAYYRARGWEVRPEDAA